jgi:hypothetical protein
MKTFTTLITFMLSSCIATDARKDYFGNGAETCAPAAMSALGLYDRDWARLLQSIGEGSLLREAQASRDKVAYRVSIYEMGNDEVPAGYQPLQSVIHVERDGAAAPRGMAFRRGLREYRSLSLDETEWVAVARCWAAHPVTQVSGLGCRQASRQLQSMYRADGLCDWVLVETVRDGEYDVADFVVPDFMHHSISEQSKAVGSGPHGAANNLMSLGGDGRPLDPLPSPSGVLSCVETMLRLIHD